MQEGHATSTTLHSDRQRILTLQLTDGAHHLNPAPRCQTLATGILEALRLSPASVNVKALVPKAEIASRSCAFLFPTLNERLSKQDFSQSG
jgi:hypothetical protein